MLSVSVNLRVGIVVLILATAGYLLLKKSTELGVDRNIVRARLSDVRGIPVGAPVTLAGLPVGRVVERRVGSGYAEIDIQFGSKIDLRNDATLHKRRTSLLSGPSLEIDPGVSELPLAGRYILQVDETSAIGDILYDISAALPATGRLSEEGLDRAEDFRAKVNGPFTERILSLDSATADIQERVHSRLGRIDEVLKVGENLSYDTENITRRLDRTDELTRLAREHLAAARTWVARKAAETRTQVDEAKFDWSPYADPVREVDEGEGTLGRLLNSSVDHDDIADATGAARSFVRSVVSWQMRVGLRGEISTIGGTSRAYVTLKAGRTNQYYYFELLSSSQGGTPEVKAVYDQASGQWRREVSIRNELRLTAQWARRLGPVVFRYGIKESTFGAGTDIELIDNRLELSADVFELGRADRPHLKVAATYRVFGQLYLLAGIDDGLNPGRRYDIVPLGTEDPKILDDIYLGRDYYLGGSLRFTDRDLTALLQIGGDVLTGLAP